MTGTAPDQVPAVGPAPAWRSRDDLLVLNAVRLGGFAETAGVAERAGLDPDAAEGVLLDLGRDRLVERMGFADTTGWILTDAGRDGLTDLLARERAAAATGPLLAETADRFEAFNIRFVTLLTDWQLRSPADQAAGRADVVRGLSARGGDLDHLLDPLVRRLPRFARYPRQFAAAVDHARAGADRWVAGVGILSCHTVWAELHQDLLSSLGRGRGAGTGGA